MVVGHGKSRPLVDRMVKKEALDHCYYDDLPASSSSGKPPSTQDDDDLTLLHWSKSPKHMSSSTTDRRNKFVENQYKLLNIQKMNMDSVTKQVASDQAQKFTSSIKLTTERTLSPGEARSSAVIRAEAVRSKLETKFPSFVTSLVRSHVAGCFWMGLPALFCKRHLPDKDATITLEDESGKEYQLKYIAYKTGLSAGWRQFSAMHKLQEGDVLVFQLVEPTKFKVLIIRADGLSELDGALSLTNLDSYAKRKERAYKANANTSVLPSNSPKRKHAKSDSPSPVVQKKKKISPSRFSPKVRQSAEQSEYESDEVGSEVLEGVAAAVKFNDVKGFENFSILIDGVPIDAELPHEVRNKYYKLCYSQHAFLHDNLIKGINYNLIVGIISEVVNISDAMRASTLITSHDEYAKWDRELVAFEHLGMNVEFLRHRLRRLVSIAYEAEEASETRRYLTSRTELSRADDEINNIETKLEELKEACDSFGAYLESLRYKADRYHQKFQQEVTAPW